MFKWITGLLFSVLVLTTSGCVPTRGSVRFGVGIRVVTYVHGHSYHICGSRCVYYSPPVITWPHRHRNHICQTSCNYYVWPHGHYRHRCYSACRHRRVIFYSHGHRRHHCRPGCR